MSEESSQEYDLFISYRSESSTKGILEKGCVSSWIGSRSGMARWMSTSRRGSG